MDDLSFGQRIVAYRAKKKMLQRELAEKVGITPTALNYYEKDKREPNVHIIKGIAAALDITGDELLGMNSKPQLPISLHEQKLIVAYRNNPAMQSAVDKLLGIDTEDAMEAAEEIAPNSVKRGVI